MKQEKYNWEFDVSQPLRYGEAMQKNDDRIIRMKEVLRMCGVSRSTLLRRIDAGEFPAPVSLGARAIGWREGEVRSYS
jgi:prophage regulatory protein